MQSLNNKQIMEPLEHQIYLPTYLPTYLCDSSYCSDTSDSSDSSESSE